MSITTRQRRRTRGTALVLVLGMTTLLVTLGIAATQIARGELKRNTLAQDQADARVAAQYAIDYIHKTLNGRTSWRDNASNGSWNYFAQLDDVSIAYAYVDEIDGDLTNDATQPFFLYTLAIKGDSRRVYRIELIPDDEGNLIRNDSTFEQGVFE
jgi:type II secretory pathway component PulK